MSSRVALSSLRMSSELNRVYSYGRPEWPSNLGKHGPLMLARVGFYFDGPERSVTCYCCKLSLLVDKLDVDVGNEHKRLSPQCQLVQNCSAPHVSQNHVIDKAYELTAQVSDDQSDGQPLKERCKKIDLLFREAYARATKSGAISSSAGSNGSHEAFKNLTDARDKVHIDPSNPGFEQLRSKKARLSTFHNWPQNAHADPVALAAAGLFYTGTNDRVQCVYCRGYMKNWEAGDVPDSEHKKYFPQCPFVLGNFPPEPEDSAIVLSSMERHSGSNITRSNAATRQTGNTNPLHPEFEEPSARAKSFIGKRIPKGQSIETLVDAGLFYIGPEDNVKCFFCDGGLRNWKSEDNPWIEHAKYYPRCRYLMSRRDKRFIEDAQRGHRSNSSQRGISSQTSTTIMSKSVVTDSIAPVAGRFKIESREIKARMDSPIVRAVLGIGYSRAVLQRVIEQKLSATGDDFRNAESLVEAIIELEEQQKRESEQSVAAANVLTNHARKSEIGFAPTAPVLTPLGNEAAGEAAPSRAFGAVNSSVAQAKKPANVMVVPDVQPQDAAAAPANKTAKSNKKKKKKKQKRNTEAAAANGEADSDISSFIQSSATNSNDKLPADNSSAAEAAAAEFEPESRVLLEENRQLKEERLCKVCLDAESNTVFLPCGHLACCNTCSPALKNCPICRASIRSTVRIFVS